MINSMKELSIYIHIPFCRQKCLYCDFLSAPLDEMLREQYVQALCEEISAQAQNYTQHQVISVFFGGGTPSLLNADQIGRIFERLRVGYAFSKDTEITMEMNPGTVTREMLSAYLEGGGNRISLGLQSADDKELKTLGRIHTWEEFVKTYELCRKYGADNINVDLMSALPGQTFASYQKTLEKTTALFPEHISAYSLIIEEGTPFYAMYGEEKSQRTDGGKRPLPDEDTERQMYVYTKEFLEKQGYHRYEISNYAKSGKECRHNCVYWRRGDYAGFGVGAASMVEDVRWSNVSDIRAYLSLRAEEKMIERARLSRLEQIEETMFLGLRMMEGVSKRDFMERFHVPVEEIYASVIEKHCRNGLLINDECLRLTDKGVDVSNYVFADFLIS